MHRANDLLRLAMERARRNTIVKNEVAISVDRAEDMGKTD